MQLSYSILNNSHPLDQFTCGKSKDHKTLDIFLKQRALHHQKNFIGTTLLALDSTNTILGYETLLADSIKIDESLRDKFFGHSKIKEKYPAYPALKIGRLAVRKDAQSKGVGKYLFQLAVGTSIQSNKQYGIGIRFIVVDAKGMSRTWYLKTLRFKTLDDKKPDFLYYDLKGWRDDDQ